MPMPTYDRECQNPKCGHRAESFEPITPRKGADRCPKCNGRKFIRMIGTGTFADARLKREIRQYPYKAWTMPLKRNPETGRMERLVVQSPAHEREIMAGAFNGEQYEKGQLE